VTASAAQAGDTSQRSPNHKSDMVSPGVFKGGRIASTFVHNFSSDTKLCTKLCITVLEPIAIRPGLEA